MGLIKKYMNQTRKPEGVLGKMMLKGITIMGYGFFCIGFVIMLVLDCIQF